PPAHGRLQRAASTSTHTLSLHDALPIFADRAAGYGMPGLPVDGNDIAAVFAAVTAALERGRNGDGPTLIECLTYRMESHTNSDEDRKSTRLNSSHVSISYAVLCLKKKSA